MEEKSKLSIRVVKSNMNKKVVSGGRTYRSFQQQYNHDFRLESMDATYLARPNEENQGRKIGEIDNGWNEKNRANNFTVVENQWNDIQKRYKDFHGKKLHSETKPVLNFLLSFKKDFDLSKEDRKNQLSSVENFIKNNYDFPIYLVQHNDEKSLHYSFSIINYDEKTERPLSKQLNTSLLQDQIANHLKEDGMDFGHTRGEAKGISLSKHRTIMEGKTAELEEKLLKQREEIEELKNEKKEIEKDAEAFRNEIQKEITKIISDFTEAGLNYKGRTPLSLTNLAKKYLKLDDRSKLNGLLAKLEKLTGKSSTKTRQP